MKKIFLLTLCVLLFACTSEQVPEKQKDVPTQSIELDRYKLEMAVGDVVELIATVNPKNATNRNVEWNSSDQTIVSVENGEVKAIGPGRAIVTAHTEDGECTSDECVVYVSPNVQTQKKGPMTLSLRYVTATTAVLSGFIDERQVADYDMSGGGVGFIYAPSGTELNIDNAEKVSISSVDSEDAFSKTLTGLKYDTRYAYTIFLRKDGIIEYGETQYFDTKEVTISVDQVSAASTKATLMGRVARLPEDSDVKVGLMYSSSNSFTSGSKSYTITPDNDGSYTQEITGLTIEATYYYRTYLYYGGKYEYGETKEFTTNPIDVTLEVYSTTPTTVTFYGKMNPASEKNNVKIGIELYNSETFKRGEIHANDITDDGTFATMLHNLSPGVQYFYKPYVYLDSKCHYGEVKNFTTPDPYNTPSALNVSSATDLSSSVSANCYIVSESGLYKFKTVKGNSTTSVGSVSNAGILWETFGTSTTPQFCDLIKAFCYKDGYIVFQTADTFKEGNAAIAAKDDSGNILWSLHIWFTDQPAEQKSRNKTVMDRNLGATSATPGDIGTLGLFYQWGRKDPFLGFSSISSNTIAKSTIAWDVSYGHNGTIAYATAHPTSFLGAIKYNDWYKDSSSTEDPRWTTSSSRKSIYDPCPAGWRVPDVWSKAIGWYGDFVFQSSLWDSTNKGINFTGYFGYAQTIWYPASGYRSSNDGSYYYAGQLGCYWSATIIDDSDDPDYMRFDSSSAYLSYRGDAACAQSVRCVKEYF